MHSSENQFYIDLQQGLAFTDTASREEAVIIQEHWDVCLNHEEAALN